jgi:LysM domain-containing protein
MFSSWLKVALSAILLFKSPDTVVAQPGLRQPASPSYQGRDACPGRCSIAGPNPSNWSLYHNFDQIQSCQQTVFYEFSLYDGVDNPNALHRIYACTSYGPDWTNLPNSTTDVLPASTMNTTYQIGWWSDGTLAGPNIRTLSRQVRHYLTNGYGATNKTVILFARSGKGSVGLYIGKGLQNEGTGSFALKAFEDSISSLDANTGSVAMQLCQPGDDGDHIFGFMATSNTTFTPVQDALKSWSNATCLSFNNATNITGPAFLTTPSVISANATNSTSSLVSKRTWAGRLVRRADCTTVQVASGDSCYSLSVKCSISPADFTTYNPDPNLCATLQPLQHVCCSPGTLPNFAPQPNPDGSCATYTVQSGDYCGAIAAANSISIDQLNDFNSNTWAWNGCSELWVGTIICLSSGTSPMPAPVANALCGPQVPGTTTPPSGTDISTLNPCPLNACCDVWGQVRPSIHLLKGPVVLMNNTA